MSLDRFVKINNWILPASHLHDFQFLALLGRHNLHGNHLLYVLLEEDSGRRNVVIKTNSTNPSPVKKISNRTLMSYNVWLFLAAIVCLGVDYFVYFFKKTVVLGHVEDCCNE